MLARTTSATFVRCGELPDPKQYSMVLLVMENSLGSPFGSSMLPMGQFLTCVDPTLAMQYFTQGKNTFYAAYAYMSSDGGLHLKREGSSGDGAMLYGIP